MPPVASRQEGAVFHLKIIAHFAEGAAEVADPKVVHRAGHYSVDAAGGGTARLVDCTGFFAAKFAADDLNAKTARGMDLAFVVIPLVIAVTGLLLLVLRALHPLCARAPGPG